MRIRGLAILFVIVAGTEAFPCTCGSPPAKTMREVAEWYTKQQNVSLIFEGKVTKQVVQNGSAGIPATAMSMTGSGQFRIVDFAVTHVFRGRHRDHISILTGVSEADCGYNFQTGQTYLVFASANRGGGWFTSLCSGTNASEDAGAARRLLIGEQPTAEDLLSPEEYEKHYIEQILPKRTGTVCGQVLKPDGTPLEGAVIELWEVRNDDLPSRSASDENTSTADGHFCIQHAEPGRYLLTAESSDFDNDARYMAFYPGVYSREEAIHLYLEPGVRLPDVKLITVHEPLYTIRIRVITPDGTQVSYKNGCGVRVDSVYHDPLSYHISNTLEADGRYAFGYLPAGTYVVATYFEPNFEDREKPFPEALKWRPGRQEVIVRGNTDVVIRLEPLKPK